MSVYLSISIGDQTRYKLELEEFNATQSLLSKIHVNYSLKPFFKEMNAEEVEIAREILTNTAPNMLIRTNPPENIHIGKLVFRLFTDESPKTCENFESLCTGSKGTSKTSGKKLHYVDCPMHRIIPGFMAQGDDVVFGDGSGSDSIFGKKFKDENLKRKIDGPCWLCMANSGKNSNSCQFFVSFAAAPQCDGKHVVFGQLVDGMDVLKKMEAVGSPSGATSLPVIITDCGKM